MNRTFYKIGTRNSDLALQQCKIAIDYLTKAGCLNNNFTIVPVTTTGDKLKNTPLTELGGKGLFSKELHIALVNKEIDLAVHSLKDLESQPVQGVNLAFILPRGNVNDVLISHQTSFDILYLPHKAKIGTCSPRRKALLKLMRPDLDVIPLRGNVLTRLRKLLALDFDAIVLSLAGLQRLGLISHDTGSSFVFEQKKLHYTVLNPEEFLPAIGQGAIAIEVRSNDLELLDKLQPLNNVIEYAMAMAERSLLYNFSGNCHTALGAYTKFDKDIITLQAMYINERKAYCTTVSGKIQDFDAIGAKASKNLKEKLQSK